jgi:hypothetical protein
LTNRIAINIFASSSFSGFIYWIMMFGWYCFKVIISGKIPFDAIVIIFPVMIISWGAGLFLCLPAYIILNKTLNVRASVILVVSVVIAVSYEMIITNRFSDISMHFVSAISGLAGGILFLCLEKKSLLSRKCL